MGPPHRLVSRSKPTSTARKCGSSSAHERPGLLLELAREDVHLLDLRRLAQQLIGLLHQRGGDGSGEVRLATGFVGEDVEDTEGCWGDADREPRGGCLLLLGERQRPSRKLATSCSFPGLASSRARTPTVTMAAPSCRLNSHGTAELRFTDERA